MTRLTLVRHGETEWSKAGRHTSVTDLPLTEHGEEQARALIGRLHPAAYGLVLSSPRLRARRTAEIAGFVDDHEPTIEPDLAEWFYGEYEGLTSKQIQETVADWTIWSKPALGGETADQVSERLDRVVARVRSSGVENAICFAHGHSLRALTTRWLGFPIAAGVHFPLDTSTVSILGEAKGEPALELWNARLG